MLVVFNYDSIYKNVGFPSITLFVCMCSIQTITVEPTSTEISNKCSINPTFLLSLKLLYSNNSGYGLSCVGFPSTKCREHTLAFLLGSKSSRRRSSSHFRLSAGAFFCVGKAKNLTPAMYPYRPLDRLMYTLGRHRSTILSPFQGQTTSSSM